MLTRTINLYRNAYEGLSKEVWLLSFVMLINRSGTMVLPFLTLYMTSALGFTLAQAGLVMSTFGAGSIVGSLIGGKLADKIGPFKVMFWSLFLSLFAFISLIWVREFYSVCAMIFVTSIIAESFRPANFAAIADCSRPENRTRAVGLIRLAINLGMALGPAVGGLIAASMGFKYLFIIDGVTCFSAALLLKSSLSARFGNIQAAKKQQQEAELKEDIKPIIRPAYKDRRYLFFLLLVFFNAVAFFQIFASEPIFLRDIYLFDERKIGLLLAFNALLVVATEMPLIYILERHLTKLQIVNIGTFLIGLAYFVLIFLPAGWTAALFSMFLLTLGEMTSLPFLSTMALNRSNERNRGQYMALFTMTYSVAHIVAPSMGLQIAQAFNFNTMWYVIVGVSLMACLGFFVMSKTSEHQSSDNNKLAA